MIYQSRAFLLWIVIIYYPAKRAINSARSRRAVIHLSHFNVTSFYLLPTLLNTRINVYQSWHQHISHITSEINISYSSHFQSASNSSGSFDSVLYMNRIFSPQRTEGIAQVVFFLRHKFHVYCGAIHFIRWISNSNNIELLSVAIYKLRKCQIFRNLVVHKPSQLFSSVPLIA